MTLVGAFQGEEGTGTGIAPCADMSTPTSSAAPRSSIWFLLLLSVVVSACNTRPVARDVPASVAPLGENLAPALRSDGDELGGFFEVVSGEREGVPFAHARGVIEAPLAEVLAAIRPENVINSRRVDASETMSVEAPGADHAFELRNTVEALITVRYSLIWKVKQSDETGYARWDLSVAPAFIRANRGSVVLHMLADNITEIELMHELDAPRTSPRDLEVTLRDLFEALRQASLGDAEPAE